MPLSGTLTTAHLIDALAESNGYIRKKSIETVEILLELIKKSLEYGNDEKIVFPECPLTQKILNYNLAQDNSGGQS